MVKSPNRTISGSISMAILEGGIKGRRTMDAGVDVLAFQNSRLDQWGSPVDRRLLHCFKRMAGHQLDLFDPAAHGLHDQGGNPSLHRGNPLPECGRTFGCTSHRRGLSHLSYTNTHGPAVCFVSFVSASIIWRVFPQWSSGYSGWLFLWYI